MSLEARRMPASFYPETRWTFWRTPDVRPGHSDTCPPPDLSVDAVLSPARPLQTDGGIMLLDESDGHHPPQLEFDPFFDLWFDLPTDDDHPTPTPSDKGIEDLVEMLYR
jgi:hypothetical protein